MKALVSSTRKMIRRNNAAYQAVAVAMSCMLVFTMVFSMPMAHAQSESEQKTITSISNLGEDVTIQYLDFGASEGEIVFPDSITAVVETQTTVVTEVITEKPKEVTEELEEEIEETEETEESEDSEEEVTEEETTEEDSETEASEGLPEEETTEEVVESNEAVDYSEDNSSQQPAPEVSQPAQTEPVQSEPVAPAEPVQSEPAAAEPAQSEPAPAEPVVEETNPVAFIIDLLFPAIIANAEELPLADFSVGPEIATEPAAEEAVETSSESSSESSDEVEYIISYETETVVTTSECTISGITWVLDGEKSSAPEFDSTIEGARFVYVANISSEYHIATALPTIKVFIGTDDEDKAFEQSVLVDGVLITVKADPGVFPKDAKLFARSATAEETAVAEEAVESERDSEEVASSYTFDIKILNEDEIEIQPDTTKGSVTVSFALEEATNDLLEADIYHITDSNPEAPVAEKLDSDNYENIVEAETTGFSFYTVEFTYNGKQYVLDGYAEVALSDILETFDIYGEVTEAYSSDPNLFDVYYVRDNWRVAAVNAFTSLETLTVVVDGETIEIPVTDSQVEVSNGSLVYDNDNSKSAKNLAGVVLSDGIYAYNTNRTGTVYTFSNGDADIGISEGIVLDTSGQVSGATDPDLAKDVSSWHYNYGGDTSSLEFELVAQGDLLNFNYAFASREFDQPSNYNDAFGLYVSINGGAYTNIAKITRTDGSKVPVTIVNLRAGASGTEMGGGAGKNPESGTHSLFHYTTMVMNDKEPYALNGISNVFNAQIPVNVNDKVRVKFVICDCGDTGYNSYVFIEGNSLSFEPVNSEVDYAKEELIGLEKNTEYTITCEDETYTFTTTSKGSIPLSGTDSTGKEYDFYGKEIVIEKVVGEGQTPSAPKTLDISEKQEAKDISVVVGELDASKPSELPSNNVTVTEDSITINIDLEDPDTNKQKYCLFDSEGNQVSEWQKPSPDGQIVFDNLNENETYTVKAKKDATNNKAKSDETEGVQITTKKAITAIEPEETTYVVEDGQPVEIQVETDTEGAKVSYSLDPEEDYKPNAPKLYKPGEQTVYYKITDDDYPNTYGQFDVNVINDNYVEGQEPEEEEEISEESADNNQNESENMSSSETTVDINTIFEPSGTADAKSLIGPVASVQLFTTVETDALAESEDTAESPALVTDSETIVASNAVDELDGLDDSNAEFVQAEDLENVDKIAVEEVPVVLGIGEGSVIVRLEYKGDDNRRAGLADAAQVANSILTDEQKALVAAGSVLEIKVEVTPIDKRIVPEFDRQVIDNGVKEYAEELPNLTMADYVDISMFFRIDDSDWNQITDTDPIDIVINIPNQYLGLSDSYYIMRAHQGVSTLLNDLDSDSDTITISTGQFSTYALMYNAPQAVEEVILDEECAIHWFILLVATVGVIMIYVNRKNRRNVYIVDATAGLIMLILAIMGSCHLDYLACISGVLAHFIFTLAINKEEASAVEES